MNPFVLLLVFVLNTGEVVTREFDQRFDTLEACTTVQQLIAIGGLEQPQIEGGIMHGSICFDATAVIGR